VLVERLSPQKLDPPTQEAQAMAVRDIHGLAIDTRGSFTDAAV
jgi:hypothetical protein